MNAEVKPGYKQTELGDIPDDWIVQEVQALASVRGGKRLPLGRSLVSDVTGHPYIRVTDMVPGGVDTRNIQYVPEDIFPQIKNYRIYIDDIFISVAGTLGIVGKIPHELDGANLTENADRITAITCNRDFLLYNLMSPRIQGVIESEKTVGAQPKLALGRIESFQIAIPPNSEEQKAIASALSDMDALISSLDQLIAKKRDIQQATMQQLLTGQRRLPGFSGARSRHALRDLVSTPVTDGPHETPRFVENGIPFLSVNNIANNRIDFRDLRFISREDHRIYSKKCRPQRNDLLLGKAASVGKVALIETDIELNIWSPIALIRMSDAHDPRYFYYAFRSKEIGRQIEVLTNSSSQGNIGMGDIERLIFSVPDLAEQNAIATILSDMDTELAVLEARRNKARDIKQGMMQALLTGRIRLV